MNDQLSHTNARLPAIGDARAAKVRAFYWDRFDALWLVLIVGVAFVLRLVYIHQLRASPYFDAPAMDPLFHHDWARAFAAGETYWDGAYFRAPLYPWFLGLIYKIFGTDNALAPRIVQAGFGSLSCGMLYLLGRLVFSRVAGILAGLAAATYWIFMYFEGELLIPVLIMFLDLVLLWLLLWTGDRKSPLAWVVCGLALGVSAIARPNILLLAPALVVWIFVLHRRRWKRAFGYSICLFFGTFAPILPVTIRNYVVADELVLIATQGGVNFYIGNNLQSDGKTAVIPGDPGGWWPCYEAQIARAEQAMGRPLEAAEVSQWYFRQTLRFFLEQPIPAAKLLLKKLGYFWSYYELWNNQDIYFVAKYYTPIARYLPLNFGIVGPLGVLGLCLCLAHGRRLFPLWGFVLIYMISVVLFFVNARYRIPVAAVLILLGSHAVCWFMRSFRERKWPRLGLAVLVLLAMGFVGARTPDDIDELMLQQHSSTGMKYARAGEYVAADQMLSELVRRAELVEFPLEARYWRMLGYVRLKLERPTDAIDCFRQAVQIDPQDTEAHNYLGVTLARLGRYAEAAAQFEFLARDNPDNATARMNLGSALARQGRVGEAVEPILRAIELDSNSAAALIETVETLRLKGQMPRAIQLLRAVQRQIPENATLAAGLVKILARSPLPTQRAEALRLGLAECERTNNADARLLDATALAQYRNDRPEQAVVSARRALELATGQGLEDLAGQLRDSLRTYEAAARE